MNRLQALGFYPNDDSYHPHTNEQDTSTLWASVSSSVKMGFKNTSLFKLLWGWNQMTDEMCLAQG